MIGDKYSFKLLSTENLGGIVDKNKLVVRPFLAGIIPEELLTELGWKDLKWLEVTVEKNRLVITKSDLDESELFYADNELKYELIEDE